MKPQSVEVCLDVRTRRRRGKAVTASLVPHTGVCTSAYLVWRSEHEAIIFLWLQQASQRLEFMDLGEHPFPGQEQVEVAALVEHLADSCDGAVQLGQTLV